MSKLYFTDVGYKGCIDKLLTQAIVFEVDSLISRNIKLRFHVDEVELRERIFQQLDEDSSLGDKCPDIDINLMRDYIITILTRYIKALTMGLNTKFSQEMIISICTLIINIEHKEFIDRKDFIELYLDDIVKLVKQFMNLLVSLEAFTNLMILDLTIDSLN
jgi:hypothetical protein